MNFQLHLDKETVKHTRPLEPLTVSTETSVRDVFGLLREHGRGCVIVCRKEEVAGIFTERDALKCMASGANLNVPIEQYMSSRPTTLSEEDTVAVAITKMSKGGFRRLPIVKEGKCPVGLLKVSTILRYLVQHFPRYVYNLPPNPNQTTQAREGA